MCDGQGRLLIFKDLTANGLYLHCEEWEWGWRDPRMAHKKEAGFLSLDQEFEARPANRRDIEEFGWQNFSTGEFDVT